MTGNRPLLTLPSAWAPIAMSLASLALVIGHIALYGVARQADEGTAAHLFQLLMAAQLPIIAFFALKRLPQAPGHALAVLALQIGAAAAAIFPIWLLDW